MKRARKLVSAVVLTSMMSSITMACSNDTAQPTSEGGTSDTAPGAPTTYPIKTDQTLTYWLGFPTSLAGIKATHQDIPFYQELQKRTGVPLKFIAPPANQAKEALNVMMASGDLPDMIEYTFRTEFPGGPEKAIKDGYILKLNDLIDKHAPNLKKYLKEHPEIDKMIKTDNGSYYAFPFIRGDASLMVFQGPIVRKDWLDELGLPVPTTIDEWTAALTAFKEKKGAAAPITFNSKPRVLNDFNSGAFVGAFGVTRNFYLDDDEIKFGPAEPGYKEFLRLFSQWYKDGLLDKNIATVDSKAMDANMASGASGATVGNAGGGIGKWQPLMQAKDPKAMLVAAPYPVLKKGDIAPFGQRDLAFGTNGMVAITGSSKNPELAVRMLDYGYGEEGHMLYNFGVEDVSYKMENGYPKYTDLIMKNPDKLAVSQAMTLHFRSNYNGPFIQDKRYIEQYLEMPNQREAVAIWEKTDMIKHELPPITPTPEESSEFAKIMTDVNTLVDEMTLKIILGAEPVDSFEQYMEKMKSLKIDRAIEIQTAALDRYNKR
ncbi:extracellular solute-binding protein [Paenibacillus xerothermodurans]|uniref:ABC transporter substrate-binding protein n=1 Tax=Paenibacillus xerothermodurans TaxID=1977292 RepID=A0A2W1NS22_PAEXE|nr:extracellular solute-binding protein [Paenibacillus xerothermodurans]PZE22355.1 ABC transporter substrate-binding protein [Paenibacillus xerothermodurans]